MSVDWAAIYESSYAELVRYLHRKVWDAERAQDLAQETFVRALDQQPENPRAWLFRVASNLASDEARAMIRRRTHLTLLKNEAVPHAQPEAPASLEQSRREQAVRQALDELSERDREVLLLWDAGFDYREIAAQTGLAQGAIGTTLARARQRLVEAHAALEEKHVARG